MNLALMLWVCGQLKAGDAALVEPALSHAEHTLATDGGSACTQEVDARFASGPLEEHQLANAWRARAQCASASGNAAEAEHSWGVALRIDPALHAEHDPAFDAARAHLPQESAWDAVVTAGDGAYAVQLQKDELAMVAAAALRRGQTELARFPLDLAAPRHRVSGVALGDGAALVLLDAAGNTLRTVALPAALAPAPAEPTRLGTAIGAAALGVGVLGAAVSSMGYAAAPSEQQLPWALALGASGAVLLAGAAFVVIDHAL